MKKIILPIMLLSAGIGFGQTPCDSGMSGSFPCDRFDLQSQVTLTEMSASSGNDSWGWTDPQDGKEYAIMGLNNGTAFIDVSDPNNPVYLGKLPTHTDNSEWRDMKTFNNYVFIVAEASGHGMQVFDLTRLRNVANPPETFTEDAHYNGFSNSHDIAINEDTGFAYSLGDNTFGGGGHFVDINDPLNPVAAGGYGDDGYCHDAQIVTYNGPDTDYTGREIFIGSNANEVVIVDVTDKSNPVGISTISYSNVGYTHQGWFTEDQRYFIATDEADEVDFGFNTRLIIFDFEDLDNPQFHYDFFGTTPASDHNVFVKGDLAYLSNYRGGLRVYDVSDIANENITEIGYFDTWPADNNASAFVGDPGAWGVYPFFESGNIVVSNYSDNGGFFLVKDGELSVDSVEADGFSVAPNPASDFIAIRSQEVAISSVVIYDVSGKRIYSEENMNAQTKELSIASFSKGMYFVTLNDRVTVKILKQ
ncbi:MAG: choice-of-anchor B family protein [Bacteroidota bacterium]